jgi:hypothetical protein
VCRRCVPPLFYVRIVLDLTAEFLTYYMSCPDHTGTRESQHTMTVEKKVEKEKKEPKGTNKSDEIRKLAKAMKDRGEKPRPVAIIASLKKQGVEVSSPQVSMVLKKMGFRPRRRRKAAAAGASAGAAARARAPQISVDDLLAARKLVSHFGGTSRALAAIEALKKFES